MVRFTRSRDSRVKAGSKPARPMPTNMEPFARRPARIAQCVSPSSRAVRRRDLIWQLTHPVDWFATLMIAPTASRPLSNAGPLGTHRSSVSFYKCDLAGQRGILARR